MIALCNGFEVQKEMYRFRWIHHILHCEYLLLCDLWLICKRTVHDLGLENVVFIPAGLSFVGHEKKKVELSHEQSFSKNASNLVGF